jgi:capsular polysaccharide transport system permease protein
MAIERSVWKSLARRVGVKSSPDPRHGASSATSAADGLPARVPNQGEPDDRYHSAQVPAQIHADLPATVHLPARTKKAQESALLQASSATIADPEAPSRPLGRKEIKDTLRQTLAGIGFYGFSFIGLVLVPAFLGLYYFLFAASDQFVVEARFAVRSAPGEISQEAETKSALGQLGSGGGVLSLASQDAFVVAHYLQSRAAILDLKPRFDLVSAFSRADIDWLSRLDPAPTIEKLERYWQNMVRTSVDGPSGIVTLQVRSFQPQDALALSRYLLEAAETLVNTLSDKAKADTLKKAEEEVRRAETQMRQALADLRHFRETEGFIDPSVQAGTIGQLLLGAMSDRIKLQNEFFVANRAMDPNSPTVQNLRSRLEGLEEQITSMRGALTSSDLGANPLSRSLVRYEELEVQRIFSERLYFIAQSGFDRARQRADRKQIYLSVFVPPSLPQQARYPERLAYPMIFAVALLIIWGIFALTCAAVEDHLY